MPLAVSIILFLLIIGWLGALTFFYFKLLSHYNSLIKDNSGLSFQTILDNLLKDTHVAQKDIATLKEQYATIEQAGQLHIQKIGLLRFNPFKDTGGDQSFIVALLDGQGTGI